MSIAAVGQFCATSAISRNKTICQDLMKQASSLGAKMIFLPEASDFISTSKDETLQMTIPLQKSEFLLGLQESAKKENIWVSVGLHERSPVLDKVYNTHMIINDEDIENGPRLMESDSTLEGEKIMNPIDTPIGKLGLETCYDMRFPEMSIALRKRGAELLAFPSAFTIPTGIAHWEILLRARAIETQSYVFAAAQVGKHNEKRASYGNSMIINPWGTVLGQCSGFNEEPSIAIATIDLSYMKKLRAEMPIMNHRRYDMYSKID